MDSKAVLNVEQDDWAEELAGQLQQAEALERDGRLEEALVILQAQMTRLEADQRPWLQTARLLMATGRIPEAERVMEEAQKYLPDEPYVFVQYAQLADTRADRSAAVLCWAAVRERFPSLAAGWSGEAAALRDCGELETADALISEAKIRFPTDAGVAFTWADLPKWRHDWGDRVERWRKVLLIQRDHPGALTGAALALIDADQAKEGERIALDGARRFPAHQELHRAAGMTLLATGKYQAGDEALEESFATQSQ